MKHFSRDLALKLALLTWLTGVWVLLWGNVTPANILGGLAVALFVVFALALPKVPVEGRFHPLSFVRLVGVLVWYAAVSTVQVAWASVRPGDSPRNAILRYRVRVKSDLVLTLMVDALNMVPGTLVLEIDRDERTIYIHAFDVGKPGAIDQFRTLVRAYENAFVATFERDSEWHPADHSNSNSDPAEDEAAADTARDIAADYSGKDRT